MTARPTCPSQWTGTVTGTSPGFSAIAGLDFRLAAGSPLNQRRRPRDHEPDRRSVSHPARRAAVSPTPAHAARRRGRRGQACDRHARHRRLRGRRLGHRGRRRRGKRRRKRRRCRGWKRRRCSRWKRRRCGGWKRRRCSRWKRWRCRGWKRRRCSRWKRRRCGGWKRRRWRDDDSGLWLRSR